MTVKSKFGTRKSSWDFCKESWWCQVPRNYLGLADNSNPWQYRGNGTVHEVQTSKCCMLCSLQQLTLAPVSPVSFSYLPYSL